MLKTLGDCSVQMCCTSPPYWGLRDYHVDGQIGLEKTPGEYIAKMVEVFCEVRRVLKDDGVLWLNLGDSYIGSWGNYGGQNRGAGRQRKIVKVKAEARKSLESKKPKPPKEEKKAAKKKEKKK
jgi:DNA modification methylase